MRAYVIIATKGRCAETAVLIKRLSGQTLQPARTIVVGAEPSDISGLAEQGAVLGFSIETAVAERAGLTIQRNAGIARLEALGALDAFAGPFCVIFFDDDYRPAPDWIEAAVSVFELADNVVGVTGHVLADGVRGYGLGEREANQYLTGELAPTAHWASGAAERDVTSAYGCNMAFRDRVIAQCRFDERLPLYAWQEDRDFTGQALRLGRVIYTPRCRGVHLGVKGARTNGVRLGYSQIANPIYLAGKGTMERSSMLQHVLRAIAANHHGAVFRRRHPGDYPGRLVGVYRALFDLARRRCLPENVLKL